MSLDDLSPEDLERAETACSYVSLAYATPDDLPALLSEHDTDLAIRLLGLGGDDLAVLLEFLLDCQDEAGALALTA